MKLRNMCRKFYSPEPASAGGAAVAAPPSGGAAPAPASAPAATPAAGAPPAPAAPPAGAKWGPPPISRLREMLQPKSGEGATPGAPAPVKAPEKVSLSQGEDGKWHAKDDATGAEIGAGYESQEAATAYLKTLEAEPPKPGAAAGTTSTAALDPLDMPFSQPLINGIKTPREAQAALVRSQQEAQRLYYEEVRPLKETLKKAEQDIADRDASLAAMQTELETARTTPPFKELTKEEISALAKEDPAAAADYIAEKKFRDRDAQARKEMAVRESQQQKDYYTKLNAEIDRKATEMAANPKDYPLFKELRDLMNSEIEKTRTYKGREGKMLSPLLGHAWSPEVAYKLAYAEACLQAAKDGATVKTDATETARLTAEASARATGGAAQPGAGAGSGAAEGDPAKKADKAYKDAMRAAGTKHNFFTQ